MISRMFKDTRILMRFVFSGWLLLTLGSLVAMYHLWWTRERVLYVGRPSEVQRANAISRAGLPIGTLDVAARIEATWPRDAQYSVSGSEVTLSYLKYLILPRVPSGSSDFEIKETPGGVAVIGAAPVAGSQEVISPLGVSTPRGLILSMVVVFSIAAGLLVLGLSFSEGVALSVLTLSVLSVLCKALDADLATVVWLMCLLGSVGCYVFVKYLFAWRSSFSGMAKEKENKTESRLILYISAGIVCAVSLWSLLMAVVVPDDWDAWAQWGPKAKILALSETNLSDVKYFVPGSGDYPLLWPSVWAFSAWLSGGWEEQWSKGWGVIFMMLTVWQLITFTSWVSASKRAGWFVGALFASMPAVPLVASWGYAEAPFWLMSMCAVTRLMRWRSSNRHSDLCWAAIFVGAAACTKNEGILLAALSMVWVFLCNRDWRHMVIMFCPTAALAGSWKLYCYFGLHTSNHAVPSVDSMPCGVLPWLERLGLATTYVSRLWIDVRQWNVVVPAIVLLLIWLLICGGWRNRINLLLPIGMLGGFLVTILMYGDNWFWQLCVAWNRLTIQFLVVLFPVVVIGIADRYEMVEQTCQSR